MSENVPARRSASDLSRPINGGQGLPRGNQAPQPGDLSPVRLQSPPDRSRKVPPAVTRNLDSGSLNIENLSAENVTINVYHESRNIEQNQVVYPGIGQGGELAYEDNEDGRFEYWMNAPRLQLPRASPSPGNLPALLGCLGVAVLFLVGAALVFGWVFHAFTSPASPVTINQTIERPKSFSDYLREQHKD